jgi:hypothetical protein
LSAAIFGSGPALSPRTFSVYRFGIGMWTSGQPLAVLPNNSPASSKFSPHVLLLVLRRNSSFATLKAPVSASTLKR